MATRAAAKIQNIEILGLILPGGPGNSNTRQLVHWMHFLLMLQACGTTCRLTLLGDTLGGLWMLATMSVGIYAWLHEMNVAFVCVWGLLCFVNFIFDIALVGGPMLLAKTHVDGGYVAMNLYISVVHIASAFFALHLYHVNAAYLPEYRAHHIMSGFDPLGHLFDSRDPEAAIAGATTRVAHATSGAATVAVTGILHGAGHALPDGGGKSAASQEGHTMPGGGGETVATQAHIAGVPHVGKLPTGVTMTLDDSAKASIAGSPPLAGHATSVGGETTSDFVASIAGAPPLVALPTSVITYECLSPRVAGYATSDGGETASDFVAMQLAQACGDLKEAPVALSPEKLSEGSAAAVRSYR